MAKPIRLLFRLPVASLPLLGLLLVGGCVGKDGSSNIEASAASKRSQDDDGNTAREPRRVCENTSIGGEPKSFCY